MQEMIQAAIMLVSYYVCNFVNAKVTERLG